MTKPSGIEAAALQLADELECIIKQMERTGDWRLSEPETRTIMDASQFLAAVACRPAASGDLRERIAQALHSRRYHLDAKDTASMFAWYAENPLGTDKSRVAIYSAYRDADAVLASLPGLDEEAIRKDERERCAQHIEQRAGAIPERQEIAAELRSLKTGSGE